MKASGVCGGVIYCGTTASLLIYTYYLKLC